MGKTAAILLPVVLAASAVMVALEPGEKAVGPEFKAEAYTLAWGKLKTAAEVNFGKPKKSSYSIELEGTVAAPDDVDAVGVTTQLEVRLAVDGQGKQMKKATSARRSGRDRSGAYSAFHGGIGQVKVPKTRLVGDATKIRKMTVAASVVVAKKRATAKLPAVVMEDFAALGHGVSVRITALRMSASRELTVNGSYKRINSGTQMPFIEAIYALGPDGEELGGGRWTYGGPFGKTGALTYRFKLPKGVTHQTLKFRIVTESETRRLAFELTDIFSR